MIEPVSLARLCTDAVPAAERFEFWAHAVSARLQPVGMQPVDRRSTDFRAEFVTATGASTTVVAGFQGPVRSEVTAAQARQRDGDTVLLSLQRGPGLRVQARGESWAFGGDSLLLRADDEPTVHTQEKGVSRILLSVPSAGLSLPMARCARGCTGRCGWIRRFRRRSAGPRGRCIAPPSR